MRTCGGCTACCKLMGVTELSKPPGVWCAHCKKGVGCGVYEDRPTGCRDFECLWLASAMPEEMRPDRAKVVFGGTTDGTRSVVYVDPATPDHWWQNRMVHATIEHMLKKFDVIIVCGNKREILTTTDPGRVADVERRLRVLG